MATVIYFIRTSKKTNPTKKISVRIRFRHGKKINIYAKSGLQVLPHYFSNETHTINKQARYSDKNRDREYLNGLEKTILDSYKGLKEPPTPDWLNTVIDKFRYPDKYKPKPKKKITLYSFIQEFIEKSPDRVLDSGKTPTIRTIQDYKKTFKDIKEFAAFKGYPEFDFSDIDKDFYKNFLSFLTLQKGYAKNTVGKKIKVLKIFLNAAAPKYISKDIFSGTFKTLSEDAENIYLTEAELNKIHDLDLSANLKFDHVRDMFLVGCWTGLRFSDWHKIRPESIEDGILSVYQDKTGDEVNIPLFPIVEEILKKYDGNLPKPISNQKFNEYLKEIARIADFKEAITKQITRAGKQETEIKPKWQMISTHTARRSFATNLYKLGFDTYEIMSITGHKKESTFLKYIKVTKRENAQRIKKKIKERFISSGSHLKIAK